MSPPVPRPPSCRSAAYKDTALASESSPRLLNTRGTPPPAIKDLVKFLFQPLHEIKVEWCRRIAQALGIVFDRVQATMVTRACPLAQWRSCLVATAGHNDSANWKPRLGHFVSRSILGRRRKKGIFRESRTRLGIAVLGGTKPWFLSFFLFFLFARLKVFLRVNGLFLNRLT